MYKIILVFFILNLTLNKLLNCAENKLIQGPFVPDLVRLLVDIGEHNQNKSILARLNLTCKDYLRILQSSVIKIKEKEIDNLVKEIGLQVPQNMSTIQRDIFLEFLQKVLDVKKQIQRNAKIIILRKNLEKFDDHIQITNDNKLIVENNYELSADSTLVTFFDQAPILRDQYDEPNKHLIRVDFKNFGINVDNILENIFKFLIISRVDYLVDHFGEFTSLINKMSEKEQLLFLVLETNSSHVLVKYFSKPRENFAKIFYTPIGHSESKLWPLLDIINRNKEFLMPYRPQVNDFFRR